MDPSDARWRKSTRSGTSGGNCVEVADNLASLFAVRDGKDPAGPALAFTPLAGRAFIAQTKRS